MALFCGESGLGGDATSVVNPPQTNDPKWVAGIYFSFDTDDGSTFVDLPTICFSNLVFAAPPAIACTTDAWLSPNNNDPNRTQTVNAKGQDAAVPTSRQVLGGGSSFSALLNVQDATTFPVPPSVRFTSAFRHISFFYEGPGDVTFRMHDAVQPQQDGKLFVIFGQEGLRVSTSVSAPNTPSLDCDIDIDTPGRRLLVGIHIDVMEVRGVTSVESVSLTIGTETFDSCFGPQIIYDSFDSWQVQADGAIIDELRVAEYIGVLGLVVDPPRMDPSQFTCFQDELGAPTPTPPPSPSPSSPAPSDESGTEIALAIILPVILVATLIGFAVACSQRAKR
jgi:hypothetical protein